MTVESSRLFLHPASDEEIAKLIENEEIAELKQAYSEMLQGCVSEPENRLWYAMWFFELKNNPGTVIGDFCFKGLNPDGTVELGYGLREGYCGNGYMTEAVKAISEWALSQRGVAAVEAETDKENLASHKVLLNAGFVSTGTYGEEGPRFVYR